MHRTKLVPRIVLGIIVLIGTAGPSVAQPMVMPPGAQPGQPPGQPNGLPPEPQQPQQQVGNAMVVPVNNTKKVMMSNKQILASVQNENPRVARVQTDLADPAAVLITGLAPGSTRVILTDRGGKSEVFDVIVPSPLDQEREKLKLALRDLIRTTVPASQVEIVVAPNNTVFLSGTVGKAEEVQLIMAAASSIFGPDSKVVNGLRLAGVHQVQLDVVIARVNRTEARRLQLNFIDGSQTYFLSSLFTGGGVTGDLAPLIPAPAIGSLIGGPQNLIFGVVRDNHSFLGLIHALRTEGLVKLMAEPKLVTLSGRPAYYLAGGKQAVPQLASGAAGGGAVSGVSFEPFGAEITFLPIVLGNGKIYLEVNPKFSFISNDPRFAVSLGGGASTVLGRSEQQVRTTVVMEDGQTFAIGGLIQHDTQGTTVKVPLLGDLPFFGTFFRTVDYLDAEEEMVILVTPRLVDPLACDQFPKHLPGQETRTPDDFELFFEGLLEAPRGPRQVFPDPHQSGFFYKPAHMNGPTSKATPCVDFGQHGHGHGNGQGCNNGNCGPTYGGIPSQPGLPVAPSPGPIGNQPLGETLPAPAVSPQQGLMLPSNPEMMPTSLGGVQNFGPALATQPR